MLRATTFVRQSASMAQSWRLQELLGSCGTNDVVFSRRVPNKGSSFFAWPGLSATEVAAGMLQMPDNLRTAHVVFGRPDVPLDLALDIDEKLPIGKEFRDTFKVKQYQRKCLEESLMAVHAALADRGEKIDSQVVLVSPNLHKLSFHVHIKLHQHAFKDYTHLSAFVKSAIAPKVPKVDTQIYRANGSLRLYQSKKEDNTCAMALYDNAFQIAPSSTEGNNNNNNKVESAPVKKKTTKKVHYRSAAAAAAAAEFEKAATATVSQIATDLTCPSLSQESIMLHSFIMRPHGTFNDYVNVTTEELEMARRSITVNGFSIDNANNSASAGQGTNIRPLMPLTAAEAIINAKTWMSMLPEELAVHYSDWIRVGLYAFRIGVEFEGKFMELYGDGKRPLPEGLTCISPMQELLRAWIDFSKRCPVKYRMGDCEQRWGTMRKNDNVPFFSAYSNLAALTRYGQQ